MSLPPLIPTPSRLSSHRWSGERMFPMAYSGVPPTIAKVDKNLLVLYPTLDTTRTRSQWLPTLLRMTLSTTQTSIHMEDLSVEQAVCRGTLPLKRCTVMPTLLRPVPTVCLKTKIRAVPQKHTLSTLLLSFLLPRVTSIPKVLATSNKLQWHPSSFMLRLSLKRAKAL